MYADGALYALTYQLTTCFPQSPWKVLLVTLLLIGICALVFLILTFEVDAVAASNVTLQEL